MAQPCAGCSAPIPPKVPEMHDAPLGGHCSKSCYMHHWNARRTRERQERARAQVSQCPFCAASWCTLPGRSGRKFCSQACKESARSEASKKPKRVVVCTCGTEFKSARDDARFCSRSCAGRWQRQNAPTGCSTPNCVRPLRAKGMCNTCYRRDRGEKAIWTDAKRDLYHRRRAQKRATADDRPVLLAEIRERDGNRCHLCRKRVSDKPYPHPLSSSLDHVIPLSLGGEHVPENVRLAHLRCNVEKGNRGGNEQLLLIG